MTNLPLPPHLSVPDSDIPEGEPVVEVDGHEEFDPDANEDLIDSADADRLASEGE
ncbi:hypothetical protein [uncultured Microbacterium sp.]|uniref:hypothetical protein n=1 Tax=uncultured Microbacterium sp. TaxID=191216 RepID=UPI002626B82A|nr:hypothetical protein [uncultured Microbacterium sp.]